MEGCGRHEEARRIAQLATDLIPATMIRRAVCAAATYHRHEGKASSSTPVGESGPQRVNALGAPRVHA